MDVSCVSGIIVGSSSGCVSSIVCGSSMGVLDESFGNVNAAEGFCIDVFVGCFLFDLWCFPLGYHLLYLDLVIFGRLNSGCLDSFAHYFWVVDCPLYIVVCYCFFYFVFE